MNDLEWLKDYDPGVVWKDWKDKASDRKLRLYFEAVFWEPQRENLGETHGDLHVLAEELADNPKVIYALKESVKAHKKEPYLQWYRYFAREGEQWDELRNVLKGQVGIELREKKDNLRKHFFVEVFGNPFRQYKLNQFDDATVMVSAGIFPKSTFAGAHGIPSDWLRWDEGVIPRLAKQIYDEKAFERMPILADAMEEAGVTNLEFLGHCRGPREGGHVRGCWLLDLITGRC